ncbi:MAG: hypothetical protein KDE56_19580 [Anaerolineales bacterium]|nr:hypothetical protein [Anaerolineales bacterium]
MRTNKGGISHNRDEEAIEAKAIWFQSLSLNERMDMLCFFTDMLLGVNPRIVEQKNAKSVAGRVRALFLEELDV